MAGRPLSIVHQIGYGHPVRVGGAYRSVGLEAELPHFMHDIASAYLAADVAVTLAGAGTLGSWRWRGCRRWSCRSPPPPMIISARTRRTSRAMVRSA